MIKITIYKNQEDDYVGFRCIGHAGYAESGKDIICAAVSVLILNTMNSIEKFTYDKFKMENDEKNGKLECLFSSKAGVEAALLMDSMVLGLQGIEEQYGNEYLKVIIKEV